MQEVNRYQQLQYISVSKSDHGHDCDDDGGDGGGHVRGISYYTLCQNVIKLFTGLLQPTMAMVMMAMVTMTLVMTKDRKCLSRAVGFLLHYV